MADRQGWQCPRCHRTYAPYIPTCAHCDKASKLREGAIPREETKIVRRTTLADMADDFNSRPVKDVE